MGEIVASIMSSSRGVSAISSCSGGSVTFASAQVHARTCVLHIPISSPLFTSSSSSLRSCMWGSARSVLLSSKDGTVSLLLLALEMSKELKAAGDRRRMGGIVWSYMENKNPVFQFLNKVQGALPVVGLVARILNPEGGVGNDRVRMEEFVTRVERRGTRDAARAFYEFSERHGKVAKPQFVLVWCWAAAVGAGLIKSDELILGAARLRVSYDLAYEVENLEAIMEEAVKRRESSGSPVPDVPVELRAEKALEAVLQCCTGKQVVEVEDAPLLSTILKNVFPTADAGQIDFAIQSRILDPSSTSSNSETAPEGSVEQGEEVVVHPVTLVSETSL